jgi:hypothetical protein
MMFRVFSSLSIAVVVIVPIGVCQEAPHASRTPAQPPLSRAGLGALEHASKLVVAINNLDWKTVESAESGAIERRTASRKGSILPILKRDATMNKDWHGIGAYRGSDYQQGSRTLIQRFAYGRDRTTPHQVCFKYSLDGDAFTFEGISILGW